MIITCNAIEKISPSNYADLPCIEVKLVNVLSIWGKSISLTDRQTIITNLGSEETLDCFSDEYLKIYLEKRGYSVVKK
jgi:hypothetical protein